MNACDVKNVPSHFLCKELWRLRINTGNFLHLEVLLIYFILRGSKPRRQKGTCVMKSSYHPAH